jgi:hypothetical protein
VIDHLCWHPSRSIDHFGFCLAWSITRAIAFCHKNEQIVAFIDERIAHRTLTCLQIQWWLLCSLRQAPFQRFIVDAIFFKMVNHSLLLFFLVTWHAFCIAFRILQNATTTPINGGMSKDPWMLSSHSMCDYHYWLEESINCSFFFMDAQSRLLLYCMTELIQTRATKHANTRSISQSSSSVG